MDVAVVREKLASIQSDLDAIREELTEHSLTDEEKVALREAEEDVEAGETVRVA